MTLYCPESTVRLQVLGDELRRLREARGLTRAQVVVRIGISETHLSRWESGRRTPSPEDVSALLVIYEVTGEERQELLALARRADQRGLWQQQSGLEARFAALKMLESRASAMVSFEPLMIPGLLQTVPYAQAIFREAGLIDNRAAIDERVVGRIRRQRVLRGFGAPTLVAVIAEGALRNQVGGRKVLRDQLRYLAEEPVAFWVWSARQSSWRGLAVLVWACWSGLGWSSWPGVGRS